MSAVAATPVPAPPVNESTGALVYPLPPWVTLMVLIWPALGLEPVMVVVPVPPVPVPGELGLAMVSVGALAKFAPAFKILKGLAVLSCRPKTTELMVSVAEHPAAPVTEMAVGVVV